jgi:hypothetical protein
MSCDTPCACPEAGHLRPHLRPLRTSRRALTCTNNSLPSHRQSVDINVTPIGPRLRRARGITLLPGKCGRAACAWAAACRPPIHCSRRSRPLRRPGPSCTRSRTSGPTCHPRSMSFYDTCVAPRYRNGPTGRRRLTGAEAFELEGMDPCYIDIDGFWPKGADSKGPESVPIAN